MANKRTTKVYIDQIEGEVAALLVGERQVILPASTLPGGAREGVWLRMTLETDEEQTADAKQRVDDLFKELTENA